MSLDMVGDRGSTRQVVDRAQAVRSVALLLPDAWVMRLLAGQVSSG
jgi:hypothetical protein